MTAKEALKERIDSLTEEEAAELLDRLEWESTEEEILTPEQWARVQEGERQIALGDVVDASAFVCTAKIDASAPGLSIGRRGVGPHPRPSPIAMGEGGRERTPRSSGSLLQAKW